jgi:acetolactate synthase I/II/III large subunit
MPRSFPSWKAFSIRARSCARSTTRCRSGHYASIAATYLNGRAAERYHVVNEFGAIGSAFATAIGIAVQRKDGKVLLVEGDGSMLMHIQELETLKRHGIRMLMCILNDGGYGAEVHKLRAQGLDASGAIHGRGDLAAVAKGFGLRGERVAQGGRFGALFRAHADAADSELWDVHVDDAIPSAAYRRIHYGES